MSKKQNIFVRSLHELKSTRCIAVTALLIAINITLDLLGLTIKLPPNLRIGFGFLCNAAIGMLFGPVVGMMAGVCTDVLGYFAGNLSMGLHQRVLQHLPEHALADHYRRQGDEPAARHARAEKPHSPPARDRTRLRRHAPRLPHLQCPAGHGRRDRRVRLRAVSTPDSYEFSAVRSPGGFYLAEKLTLFRQMCSDCAEHRRPKVPVQKLSPSQCKETEAHVPGFFAFAQQTLFHARCRATVTVFTAAAFFCAIFLLFCDFDEIVLCKRPFFWYTIYDRRRTARLTAFSPEKDAFPLAAPFTERM